LDTAGINWPTISDHKVVLLTQSREEKKFTTEIRRKTRKAFLKNFERFSLEVFMH
jgi:hypothetical protein